MTNKGYTILDNDEELITVPTLDEAVAYVEECKLEDILECDEAYHKYLIKDLSPPKTETKNWPLLLGVWFVIKWTICFIWWVVWFTIKCIAFIVSRIILTTLKLILFGIQASIFLILLLFGMKSKCMD